jgi:hypothetical protein
MFHPLLSSPADLKDAELDEKIFDLTKKYYIASNLGQGGAANQIVLALEMYRDEQLRRQYEASQNLMKKQNKDLDGLINVD